MGASPITGLAASAASGCSASIKRSFPPMSLRSFVTRASGPCWFCQKAKHFGFRSSPRCRGVALAPRRHHQPLKQTWLPLQRIPRPRREMDVSPVASADPHHAAAHLVADKNCSTSPPQRPMRQMRLRHAGHAHPLPRMWHRSPHHRHHFITAIFIRRASLRI